MQNLLQIMREFTVHVDFGFVHSIPKGFHVSVCHYHILTWWNADTVKSMLVKKVYE